MSAASQGAAAYLATLDLGNAPGLFVNVLHKSVVALTWSCGLADLEHGIKWSDETLVPLASHTKCLTAFVLMRLHEADELSLDEPVGDLLAGLPKSWRALTLRECLSNISGLPYDEQIAWLHARDWRTPTSRDWLQRISARVEPRPPRTEFLYNDANFRLAVRAAEAATGYDFDVLLRKHIFQPLEMNRSRFERRGERAVRGKAAVYSRHDDNYFRHLPYMELSGDGAALSTMSDLRRWAFHLLAMSDSKDPALAAMRTAGRLHDGRFTNYGLGLSLGRHRGHQSFGHSGAGAGYATVFCIPDAGLAVVVLANRSDIDPNVVACNCADFWLDSDAPASARAAFAAQVASSGGAQTFVDSASGAAVTLERRGDVLRVDALGDYAFLRETAAGKFETEDGRLDCILDFSDCSLRVGGMTLRLVPCVWRRATGVGAIAGRFYQPEIDCVARITESHGGQLLIADGPDHQWQMVLEQCQAPDVFRAESVSGRVHDDGLTLISRGLPPLRYVRTS